MPAKTQKGIADGIRAEGTDVMWSCELLKLKIYFVEKNQVK